MPLLSFHHKRRAICLEFKPQDLWIGLFWQTKVIPAAPRALTKLDVYVCLIPCFPIHYIQLLNR